MEPVILVVADDPVEVARLRDELGRYARDYQLDVVADSSDTVTRLADIEAAGGAVAMVLADLALATADSVDVLARVRSRSPTVRCVLLLEWGLRGDQMPAVSHAQALGVVDTVLTKPTGRHDEESTRRSPRSSGVVMDDRTRRRDRQDRRLQRWPGARDP